MTEPTPPPERPLTDEARARIRAELLAGAGDSRTAGPRWLVPAGAAAAVALVAGMAYWAIDPGSESSGLPATGGGASGVSGAPTTPGATDPAAVPTPPSSAPMSEPMVDPTSVPSTAFSEPTSGAPVQVGTGTCETELEYVLKGAQLAEQIDATSSFWVKGDRFSLCYAIDGSTTVTHPLPLSPRDDVATFRVLSLYPPAKDGYRTVRAAGGVVPPGMEEVMDVAYTFPNGHTERATTATDDQGRTWWLMSYVYDDGGGSELDKPPITVRVRLSGVQHDYTLDWGLDTCAQANHGC